MALLADMRVVEIGDPTTEYAGKILAEMGAEVFLVEPPGGAATRARRPYAPGAEPSRRSIPFLARNHDKRGVVFDPDRAGDEASFRGLLAASDVLLAPARSAFDRWLGEGDGVPCVRVADPEGLGRSALVTFAASGGLASSGWPERAPCNAPSWMALDAAGIYVAVLAVLAYREGRAGREAEYEVSLREAAIAGVTPWTRPLHSYGQEASGQGIRHRRLGPVAQPIFPCADGYVRALMNTQRQWDAFVELMAGDESISGEEWRERSFRREHLETLFHIGSELTKGRERRELFERGQSLGLTITPVYSVDELRADRHVRERGLFVEVADLDLGAVQMMREPVRVEPELPRGSPRPAPALGADQEALAELRARGRRDGRSGGSGRPLAGVRVLNLGAGAVVPEAAELLALLGAEVIKVESRRRLDFLRQLHVNGAASFNQLNLGVKSLAVDMTTAAGRQVVQELAPLCDIVMENMRAPVMRAWGCDYASLRELRPDLIYFSSQGLGRGPYGDFQTFGPNLQAFSGITASWAHPEDPYPVGTSLNHPDHVAGKQALLPILGALIRRDATGEGCFIEGAQFEVAAEFIADKFLQAQVLPGSTGPVGNCSEDFAPHGVYPCVGEDRWVAIAVANDAEWEALRGAIGAEWAGDARFATHAGRLALREELDARIEAWTRDQEPAALESRLQRVGVAASRVVIGEDMAESGADHASGFFASLDHPLMETHPHTGLPFRDGSGRRPALRRAPLLGEHTEHVLYEVMGLEAERVQRLMAEGAVGW